MRCQHYNFPNNFQAECAIDFNFGVHVYGILMLKAVDILFLISISACFSNIQVIKNHMSWSSQLWLSCWECCCWILVKSFNVHLPVLNWELQWSKWQKVGREGLLYHCSHEGVLSFQGSGEWIILWTLILLESWQCSDFFLELPIFDNSGSIHIVWYRYEQFSFQFALWWTSHGRQWVDLTYQLWIICLFMVTSPR